MFMIQCIFSEVMSQPVVTLRTVENVGVIVDVLKNENFNGFPVVEYEDDDGVRHFLDTK